MPRVKRITKGGIAYHVLNRANGRLRIFKRDLDFIAFENILAEGIARFGMRLCGYCIMSNHWHLLLWPLDDDTMVNFMRWITLTHTQRWHASHGTVGIGHVYQGPYKSFPIQSNWRYLKAMQYIEANPIRAGLVDNAADWQWSSFIHRIGAGTAKPFKLDPGPVPLSQNWSQLVNQPFEQDHADELANCINKGSPYGQKEWTAEIAEQLNLQSTLRSRGRPRKFK
ncbi:MAG: transposase [Planctomycetes bacterium]|nr:transposase [Planctomycetota bacterium]